MIDTVAFSGERVLFTHTPGGYRAVSSVNLDDFAWSRDGKRHDVARVTTTRDIVLFKGLSR
jgi:hypothetical protein